MTPFLFAIVDQNKKYDLNHPAELRETFKANILIIVQGARADCVAFGDYGEAPVHCACINPKPRIMLEVRVQNKKN